MLNPSATSLFAIEKDLLWNRNVAYQYNCWDEGSLLYILATTSVPRRLNLFMMDNTIIDLSATPARFDSI